MLSRVPGRAHEPYPCGPQLAWNDCLHASLKEEAVHSRCPFLRCVPPTCSFSASTGSKCSNPTAAGRAAEPSLICIPTYPHNGGGHPARRNSAAVLLSSPVHLSRVVAAPLHPTQGRAPAPRTKPVACSLPYQGPLPRRRALTESPVLASGLWREPTRDDACMHPCMHAKHCIHTSAMYHTN